jgi:predicted acylesterase/phospholipase RssA
LGDSICRLVIPSFDANRANAYLYKTAHHPRLRTDYHVPVWEVAMATAAAPTYFPSYTSDNKIRFIDGGIWANNPTMVALVEAISLLGIQLNDIYLLSFAFSRIRREAGEYGYVTHLDMVLYLLEKEKNEFQKANLLAEGVQLYNEGVRAVPRDQFRFLLEERFQRTFDLNGAAAKELC